MTSTEFTNTLYTNDNLFILNGLNSNLVDLIYLDPPFNTNAFYSAPAGSKAAGNSFKDMWTWADVNEEYLNILNAKYPGLMDYIVGVRQIHSKEMAAYLTYMAQRIIEMYRILKDTGSLYLHCDSTASHYLKGLLDSVFGNQGFRNEISWCYTGPSGAKRNFPAKHDVILIYTKSEKYTFNYDAIRIPYKALGGYGNSKIWGKGGLRDKEERQKYIDKGKIPPDWWSDIPSGGQISVKERVGYPTQKPLKLLQRIILASSNTGDIILDPFCGCATTCVAAQQLGRKWIGIDIATQSLDVLVDRLSGDAGVFRDFVCRRDIPQRTDIVYEPPSLSVKQRLYQQQNGKCNGCECGFEIRNLEIDHIMPKAKGGGDYYENYQLLCGNCNRIKGTKPMAYLLHTIKERAKNLTNLVFE